MKKNESSIKSKKKASRVAADAMDWDAVQQSSVNDMLRERAARRAAGEKPHPTSMTSDNADE